MIQRCSLRQPDESVVEELAQDLKAYREEFDSDPRLARALITIGEVAADGQLAPEELAAWR